MTDPVLYILMRTDLDSLNPGKAMAQASHAYGAMKSAVKKNVSLQSVYLEWQDSTDQDFGSTIVLGGSQGEIGSILTYLDSWYNPSNFVAGWVNDPTYPIKDGSTTHLIPLATCAYVFGKKGDIYHAVRSLSLHA